MFIARPMLSKDSTTLEAKPTTRQIPKFTRSGSCGTDDRQLFKVAYGLFSRADSGISGSCRPTQKPHCWRHLRSRRQSIGPLEVPRRGLNARETKDALS